VEWVGVVVIAVGLVFTGISVRYTARSVQQADDGQIKSELSQAVAGLGSDSLEVRIGSLYMLSRLALRSPADTGTIQEVLTAYVHRHAPATVPQPTTFKPPGDRLLHDGRPCEDEPGPPSDVSIALQILGNPAESFRRVDLREVDLRGIALENASFESAKIDGSDLTCARMSNVSMVQADVARVNFSGAVLKRVTFDRAKLSDVQFTGARITGATFVEADLYRVDFSGAYPRTEATTTFNAHGDPQKFPRLHLFTFIEANFRSASINGCNLSDANFYYSRGMSKDIFDDFGSGAGHGNRVNKYTALPSSFDPAN